MTKSAAIITAADALVTAYEALRAHMLTGVAVGTTSGLLVLLRQGMAAWMAPCPAGVSEPPMEPQKAAPLIADETPAALVRILASMMLRDQQEVYA